MPSPRLKFLIASRVEEIAAAVKLILRFCSSHDPSREVLSQVKDSLNLAISEALTNVIQHSYDARPDGFIRIIARMDGDMVHVGIFDKGRSMPPGKINSDFVDFDSSDVAGLPQGGWGWPIILHEMDVVSYRSRLGSNHLRLTKKLSCHARAELDCH